MPHHRHPDEGDIPFTELEFDDQIDESFENGIEVTIDAEKLGGVQLPSGSVTIHPGSTTWTPEGNPTGELNWRDVMKLTVTMHATLNGKTLSGTVEMSSSDPNHPIQAAACTLAGVAPGDVTLAGTAPGSTESGNGTFPASTALEAVTFSNAYGSTIYGYVKVAENGLPYVGQEPVVIPVGTSTWSPDGASGFSNVGYVTVLMYSNAARTENHGGVSGVRTSSRGYFAEIGCNITGAGQNNCTLSGKNALGAEDSPAFAIGSYPSGLPE